MEKDRIRGPEKCVQLLTPTPYLRYSVPTSRQQERDSFDWLNKGSGRLVVGGKLLDELEKSSTDFRRWVQEAPACWKNENRKQRWS